MIESCDAGSLPFEGDLQKYLAGASNYGQVKRDSTEFFEKKVVEAFLDKKRTGVDVPNYPQFRDMTEMFFDMIEGIEKVNGGYVETAPLALKSGKGIIAEALSIQKRSQEIREELGEPFKLRICITGPYTLASLFAYKGKGTFARLGNILTKILEANIFSSKHGRVQLVSIDEPVFGLVDDPLLDRGSESRENLLKTWEAMTQMIKTKGAQSVLHLHATSDELFWEVKALNIIESHVVDPFYQTKRTRDRLEDTDKYAKASVAVTDFDQLIRNRIIAMTSKKLTETDVNEKIAETWTNLTKKQIDPTVFIEDIAVMRQRLTKIVELFGENRVTYAGPECGLRSFPTYDSALECLRRVANTIKDRNS